MCVLFQLLCHFIDKVYAVNPVLSEDSVILSLPFGGAVLEELGVSRPEIAAILEDARKVYMEDEIGFDDENARGMSLFDVFKRKSAPSNADSATNVVDLYYKQVSRVDLADELLNVGDAAGIYADPVLVDDESIETQTSAGTRLAKSPELARQIDQILAQSAQQKMEQAAANDGQMKDQPANPSNVDPAMGLIEAPDV